MTDSATQTRSAGRTEPPPVAPRREVSPFWPERRLTSDQVTAFEAIGFHGMALVADDGPISVTQYGPGGAVARRIGHNRAVRSAKAARTCSFKDTVTPSYDKHPALVVAVQFRVWFLTKGECDRAVAAVTSALAERASADGGFEQLRHSFHDQGPDFDLDLFRLEMADIANRVARVWWGDMDLPQFLDRQFEQARRWQDHRRLSGRQFAALIEQAAVRELGL